MGDFAVRLVEAIVDDGAETADVVGNRSGSVRGARAAVDGSFMASTVVSSFRCSRGTSERRTQMFS